MMKLLFTLLLNISFLFAYSNIIKEKIRYGDSLSKVNPQAAHRYFSDLLEQEQDQEQEQESSDESKKDQAEILCRMAQLDILMGNYPEAIVEFKKASHFF